MNPQERHVWNEATKVLAIEYPHAVWYDGVLYDSTEDLIRAFNYNPPRSGVYGTGLAAIELDADDIVDELVMNPNAPDDYTPDAAAVKFIGEFVEMFNSLYSVPVKTIDRSVGIVFDRGQL